MDMTSSYNKEVEERGVVETKASQLEHQMDLMTKHMDEEAKQARIRYDAMDG